ncbi:PH domain-containing protein [Spongiactinospora sp. TRM90649]|uniref:PH domain-containing protein n=1 Tax=Spongiactinospora sp. TRM90649 TaxID=3031114 RepID=UPI0023F7FEC4|nr:PH domain-containing protein [Spongiactinospora sp. TRM90649]MDF5759240.1 PH domain-containing protein [Spongiactinospora sp. TRM90649]
MTESVGEAREWRVRRDFVVLKAVGLVLALVLVVLNHDDRRAMVLCGVAALALAVLIARDLLVPVRLAADEEGVIVVRGFAGRRRVPWSDVERIVVDVHRRYGRRWEHLEIDAGEQIYVFGGGQLGTSCTLVAAELRALRSSTGRDAVQDEQMNVREAGQ